MVSAHEPGQTTTRQAWEIAADAFTEWRAGDPRALETLVRHLTPMLWHVARAYRLDQRTAEDAVQNAWTALLRYADSIRDPRLIMAWMAVTTRRESARLARRQCQERPVEADDLYSALPPLPGHEGAVLDQYMAAILWRHVGELSDRCQHLLRIVAFEQRSDYAAISEFTGMALGSIGPTRRRCLEKLRDLLASDPEWSDP